MCEARQRKELEIRRHWPYPGEAGIPCGFKRNHMTSFYLGIQVILKNDQNIQPKDLEVQILSLSSTSCVHVGKSLNFSGPCEK